MRFSIVGDTGGSRWNFGTIKKKPAMQVHTRLYVTNITDAPVRVLSARVKRPRTDRCLILVRHPRRNVFGDYPVLPGETAEVSVDFWIQPPTRQKGEDLRATVELVDQYGNRHKAKNILFQGPQPDQPTKPEPTREALHALEDPVEKEVAAVLKAEVDRYRECGRRVGGLGSIQTTYNGQTATGVGTEWRSANSAINQSIVPDPQNASIQSDNAEALINLYTKLKTEAERGKFFGCLLKRLSREKEYAPVGYLILLVAQRIGRLPDVLRKAKRDLQHDDGYGFSDFLRLLDALLRFDHPSFDPDALDEIEKFLEDIEEHTFRIEERIAAIRTSWLLKPGDDQPT